MADAVVRQLGIAEFAADLLREDKRLYVQRLVGAGRAVAMVGDGINDVPALIEAQIRGAMGSGTDVARESADVVLLGNDLAKFAETLRIARRGAAHGSDGGTRVCVRAHWGKWTCAVATAPFPCASGLFARTAFRSPAPLYGSHLAVGACGSPIRTREWKEPQG